MTPERMLTGALLLVVAQPSLSSPYVLVRQASPLLYPASYPSGSQQTLYNGMYSPWSSFYYPSVANQRNTAPTALQAPATRKINAGGCGTWSSSTAQSPGCYKLFKTEAEKKNWQEAREQCREAGRKEGVSDADLAYFDTPTERDDVIEDLGISNSSESFWLNGKFIRSGLVTLQGSIWEPTTATEWKDGSPPTFDLNAKNLVIWPQDKKLGADLGVEFKNGFICEFKKRGCKDSTWIMDRDNQRCLKVFLEEKTYQNAKADCADQSSTLASLVPSKNVTCEKCAKKLTDLTSTHFGTWVKESASKDDSGTIQYTVGTVQVTDSLAHWTMDQSYQDTLTTVSKHLSINSAGRLVPVFDSNAKARFICENPLGTTPLGFDVAANKPLERSLLSFNPNV